jgi:hypothetical protein
MVVAQRQKRELLVIWGRGSARKEFEVVKRSPYGDV